MDLERLVLREGSPVGATGRVVPHAGLVHFEPFLPVPLVWHPPGAEPPSRPSGWGVLAEGVELETLSARREKDGSIEGSASLTGRWREEWLFLTGQAPPGPGARREVPEWAEPPCPAPAGGWPKGDPDGNPPDGPEVAQDPAVVA